MIYSQILFMIYLGPMLDPIVVSCASKSAKDTWLYHLNKILKTNRFPSFGSSPLQVLPPSFLPSSLLSHSEDSPDQSSISSSSAYAPSRTSPYLILVEYFAKLNSVSKLFPSQRMTNTSLFPTQTHVPFPSTQEAAVFSKLNRQQFFKMKISSDSACTTSMSSYSSSCDSAKTKKSTPLHKFQTQESALEKVSQKWRWGVSNFLTDRNSRSPCYFTSLNQWSSLPILQLPQTFDEPYEFLLKTQSLPVIKISFGDPEDSEIEQRPRPKRGRLTRQNAFDFDDGEETLDENANFEQINFNQAARRGSRFEERPYLERSFDSGLGFAGPPAGLHEEVLSVASGHVSVESDNGASKRNLNAHDVIKLETDV